MKTKTLLSSLFVAFILLGTANAEWANSYGSCYGKGSKNLSIGAGFFPTIGLSASFDYGFHDCISGGIGFGYQTYAYSRYWRYHYMPIVGRVAFHPFNLNVLSDKINIRNKLDVYIGAAIGGRLGWVKENDSGVDVKPSNIGGFHIRELIGLRFYPSTNFYLFVEEGSGMGTLNLGIGFKF